MASNTRLKKLLKAYGPETEVAYVRWTPSGSATQTLTEAQGVSRVARDNAGAWTVTLAVKPKAMVAIVQHIENDTTLFHFSRAESTSLTAGTVTVSHKSVAYASIASGPTASDTVDEMEVIVIMRVAS